MRTRIVKELRALLLPATLVAAASLLPLLLFAGNAQSRGLNEATIRLFMLGFYLGIPLLAATSFGAEFQQQTMVLLLVQPVSRLRIWGEKWAALGISVALIVCLQALTLRFLPADANRAIGAAALYLLAVLCSAPLWTLVAGSTTGGLAFSIAAFAIVELSATYGVQWLSGDALSRELFSSDPWLIAIRVAYSILTFWWGWRLFARIQVSGGAHTVDGSVGARGTRLLRATPSGALGNLVRKELCLHRPTFLVAGLFAAAWLVALALFTIARSRVEVAEMGFSVMMAVYLPLAVVLTGTMSVGEEETLGIRAWHLTLPVSARAQWVLKLATTLALGAGLALLLPIGLALVTRASAGVPPGMLIPLTRPGLVLVVAGGVLLSFWASTLFGHTIRAAVATGLILIALMVTFSVVFRLAEFSGLGGHVLTAIMVRYHLPPSSFYLAVRGVPGTSAAWVGVGLVVALVLWQSLDAFKRTQLDRRSVTRYVAALLTAAGALAFAFGLSRAALDQLESAPVRELRAAMQALTPANAAATLQVPVAIAQAQLEGTLLLSSATKRWLSGSEVAVQSCSTRTCLALVTFPGGRGYPFVYDRLQTAR